MPRRTDAKGMQAPMKALLAGAALLALGACTTSSATFDDARPGERPNIATDEAGLWMELDKVEDEIKRSPLLVRDEALTGYVRNVACRVAGDYCASVRIYIIKRPYFNASMAPNGMMQVWTGMLLRAENEAQLAAVLGHETGHFIERHTLQQWRAAKNSTTGLAFFQIFAAMAGVGIAGSVAELAVIGGLSQFSRTQETEADNIGLALMADAGYDPREIVRVWEAIEAESKADPDKDDANGGFLSSHPAVADRIVNLRNKANLRAIETGARLEIAGEAYGAAVAPYRAGWLDAELSRRAWPETLVLLDRLERSVDKGLIAFYRGEVYRLRRAEGDDRLALESYDAAIAAGSAPPHAWRARGQILGRLGDRAGAASSYRRYLELAPDAADRAVIEALIAELS